MTDTPVPLLAEVVAVGALWLESVETALGRIAEAGRLEGTAAGGVVASAAEDTFIATNHLRAVLAGKVAVAARAHCPWTRVDAIPAHLATQIHRDVAVAVSIPESLLVTARNQLSQGDARAFLLLVGDVAGSSISNIAGTLWDSYAEFAPAGWATR